MTIRVAINGFGRIGRQVLQAGIDNKNIEWVAINDLTDTQTLAHLLKYDSVFGKFQGTIEHRPDALIINGKTLKVLTEKDPTRLPWKELNIDVVIESTGFFTDKDGASQHLKAGAKKVIVSAPCKNPDITIVKGVNEHLYDKKKHHIISNASCTTNGLAPMIKVLNDNFGVERGIMITAHSYTADQKLVDAPHKDLRRARAAAINIVPTSTGAAQAVAETIPELKGKLNGIAWRVPTPDGSIVQFSCTVKKPTTAEKINWLFSEVSKYHMKGILEYSDEPLVSRDIIKNPHSCIFDSASTLVIDGIFVSVSGWYDNEWGYASRVVDLIGIVKP
ncbi:type I glyceraldehyde-3-phosphate dehydrogenase [Candidatus Woesearchaeota archaeon]|nr:type I glyceraldehyde-3-phosphate dehydrogenase [Candidatus Woesearchaeota archaeon]